MGLGSIWESLKTFSSAPQNCCTKELIHYLHVNPYCTLLECCPVTISQFVLLSRPRASIEWPSKTLIWKSRVLSSLGETLLPHVKLLILSELNSDGLNSMRFWVMQHLPLLHLNERWVKFYLMDIIYFQSNWQALWNSMNPTLRTWGLQAQYFCILFLGIQEVLFPSKWFMLLCNDL